MNTQILNQYNIVFYKSNDGEKRIDCKNQISSYLYVWRILDDINDFLSDINLCLNGQFDSIGDPTYDDSFLNLYGELTPSTIIISESGGTNKSIIPLSDFKELLLSWREFLSQ